MLLVGLFAASVGAGYSMTKEELSNAHATVQRGDTPVLLNTETERVEVEARALATGDQDLELVTLVDGRVASVNRTTNQVVLLGEDFGNQGELNPSSTTPRQRSEAPVVVPSTSTAFVLYPDADVVEQIGDDNTTRSPVRVPGATEVAVGDGGGGLWLLTDEHEVVHVVGDRVERTITAPTPILHLTLADGRPIAITEAGEALDVAATPLKSISKEAVPAGPNVVVPSAKGAGRYLVVLDRKGKLVTIDPRTGQRRDFTDLPRGAQHDLGAPVVLDDVVYVPDYLKHELHPRDLRSSNGSTPVAAPFAVPGRSPRFAVDVQERRVVANDAKDRGTLAITPDGRPATIDKGPGPGVETDTEGIGGDSTPSSKEKPTTPSTPPTSPPPATSTDTPPPPRTTRQPAPTTASSAPPAAQVSVPVIPPGTPRDEACGLVEASELRCQVLDVGVGGETGTVRDTSPEGGARVPEGSTVTVHVYGDSTRVPKVVGRRVADACTTINAVLAPDGSDVCDEQPMPSPGANWAALSLVAEQSPRDGEFVASGARVTVRYWDSVGMPDLITVPSDGAAACNAIIADTGGQVACQTTQGPEGPTPGTVQSSSPTAGQLVRAAGTVLLTVASQPAPPTPVPPVTTMTPEDACRTVVAVGYACDARPDALARDRKVVTQEPPAGTLQKGGSVVVHYSPYQAQLLYRLKRNDSAVYIIRFSETEEPHYKSEGPLGWAYPLTPENAPLDGAGATKIRNFMCDAGDRACGGHSPNHYFTRDSTTDKENWRELRIVGLILNGTGGQCPAGQHPISRFMDNTNGLRYTVQASGPTTAPWDYQEPLGCLWD